MAKVADVETGVHPEPLAAAILALAEKIGANQEQLNTTLDALRASQPEKQVTFGDTEYQERLKAERKSFPRPVFQHGFEADPSGESDETLRMVGELAPGTYLKGIVTIHGTPNGGIDFRYKSSTPDQRMNIQRHFGSFGELVAKCWTEAHA